MATTAVPVINPNIAAPGAAPATIFLTNGSGLINKDLIEVIVYYSPVILSFCILIISVFYQTYRGLVFFIFVTFFGMIRKFLASSFAGNPTAITDKSCSTFKMFQSNKTDGFIIFFVTFVTGYILAPMFIYNMYNVYVIAFLGLYLVVVVIYNQRDQCSNLSISICNIIYGIVSVMLSVIMLVSVGLSGTLFNEDLASDATICSMPSKQSFKCTVYKNGEIVSSSTNTNGYLPASN
jgi:hypothetical protein